MSLTVVDVSQAAVGFLSLFGGLPKKLAPPEGVARVGTAIAALVAGASFLAVKLLAHISAASPSATFWGILALFMLGISIVLCCAYVTTLERRTLVYSGTQRVVGTEAEYSPEAQNYLAKHPGLTRLELLGDFTGDTERVWPAEKVRRSRLILGAEYSILIACMALGLNLAIEVLNNTWSSPPSKKPTFKESVSKLKDIHFELDRVDLVADAGEKLADNAGILVEAFKQFPKARLIIEGHCDDLASVEYNLALGYRRAEVVKNALKAHIPEEKIQIVSLGRGSPLCSDMTEQCRQTNRRVHLTPVE